jgi:small subunit ribosomal protein S16
MKRMGRTHRPFYRVCAVDTRNPRDGRVIEELGYYDPMVRDVDARAVLNGERVNYWIGVGARPSERVQVLINKYGLNGTHVEAQQAALERLKTFKPQPPAPYKPEPKPEPVAAEAASADATESGEAASGAAAAE